MNPLGVERLCLFGMPPDDHVRLAAELGCAVVGIGLEAMRGCNPHGYADWSLRDDPALRRAMIAALRENGVAVGLCEGFGVARDGDVRGQAGDLDIAAELGAQRVNIVSTTRDLARTVDGFAALAELAVERGMVAVTEIGMGPLATLDAALDVLRQIGRPDLSLLIDTMHYFRFGGTIAAVQALDPALIGYAQLCDAPREPRFASYTEEALYERDVPGEGALPLAAFVAALPAHVPVSVEVPRRALAERGVSPRDRVAPCVAAARDLLAAAARPLG